MLGIASWMVSPTGGDHEVFSLVCASAAGVAAAGFKTVRPLSQADEPVDAQMRRTSRTLFTGLDNGFVQYVLLDYQRDTERKHSTSNEAPTTRSAVPLPWPVPDQ